MQIIDLSETIEYDDIWFKTLDIIASSNDGLKDNYQDLYPQNFLSFPVVFENNEIICFSGLQADPKKWGVGVARVSSRMWVHPDYRFQGMTKFTEGPRFLNSYYCIPPQLRRAKELGYECLFMSRERNRIAFNEFGNLVNRNADSNFLLLPERYNVCGNDHQCFQHILLNMEGSAESIWKENMSRYKDVILCSI
jgi:hypothetical protein